ncbi:thioredoxin domain-containing protein 17 [Zonotrichia albicollis]|uniref:thioredoxin domain-containing protein 17 n=1 Tax=Zonotrichia albicollis TaxID=44394 RepID=UPI003D811E6B
MGRPLRNRPGPVAAPGPGPHGVLGGTGTAGPGRCRKGGTDGRRSVGRTVGRAARAAADAPGAVRTRSRRRTGRRERAELRRPRGPGRAGPGGASAAAAMGWEERQIRGYPEFVRTAQSYHGRPIFALFCGDKDAEGRSWCPDCVTAEPIVRKELHNLPDESVFIYCLVGDRAYWKDPNNEFRRNLKLTGVPTLLKYGTPQKLVEEECFKSELVRMLFTED